MDGQGDGGTKSRGGSSGVSPQDVAMALSSLARVGGQQVSERETGEGDRASLGDLIWKKVSVFVCIKWGENKN